MSVDPLAVIVPVLRRPHRVAPLLASLEHATPQPWTLYFVPDADDRAERAAIAALDQEHVVEVCAAAGARYATKVNRVVRATSEPLIFLAADDLKFHPGWLERAAAKLEGEVGVVGTNDLCNPRTNGDPGNNHSTHTLVARWYVERGTVDDAACLLHEGYPHEYVDDEFVATAQARGAYAHAAHSCVEHLHPMVGKAPMDPIYAQQKVRLRGGRRLFDRRKHLWTSPLR